MRYSDWERRAALRILRRAVSSDDRRIADAARKVLRDEALFVEFLEMRRQRRNGTPTVATKTVWYQRWLPWRNRDAVAA